MCAKKNWCSEKNWCINATPLPPPMYATFSKVVVFALEGLFAYLNIATYVFIVLGFLAALAFQTFAKFMDKPTRRKVQDSLSDSIKDRQSDEIKICRHWVER